jgi:hypothetical protein
MPRRGPSIRSPIDPDDAARHPGQIGAASPLLFTGLIDDAAVFPPGNAPLDRALQEHLAHRMASYAGVVGPLLVPAAALTELAELVAAQALAAPLRIGVIAAGGPDEAGEAVSAAAAGPSLDVVAVELPLATSGDLAATWRSLGSGGRSVWFELDRTDSGRNQLDRLAAAGTGGPGGAKLRTGGITAPGFAPETELAAFLRHAIDRDLTFKLTAGLHHAIRCTDPTTGFEQHGVLNVLCAIKAALNGAEEDELETVLAERDPAPLVTQGNGMSEADASVIRAFWSSFGCCGVTEPIDELAALGLLLTTGTDG